MFGFRWLGRLQDLFRFSQRKCRKSAWRRASWRPRLEPLERRTLLAVDLSIDIAGIAEAAGVANVTAQLDTVQGSDVTVSLSFGGTASEGVDYMASSQSIVILAGQTSASIQLTASDDLLDESDESIEVTISSIVGDVAGTSTQASTLIQDDDAAPTVTFQLDVNTLAEAGGTATLIATLDNISGLDVTVPFAFSGSASLLDDYIIVDTQLVIPAGSTSASLTITSVDDSLFEGDETVIASVQSATNAFTSGTMSFSATIEDDDLPPDLSLTLAATSIAETGSTSLIASIPSVSGVPVTLTVSLGGTATDGLDYSASTVSLTIPVGQTSASLDLTAIDDTLHEGSETVTIDLASVSGASTTSTVLPTLTILDDDLPPTVTFQLDSTSIDEAGGTATLIATLDNISGLDVTVPFTFSGSATLGTDYTFSDTQIVIPAGSTSASLTLTSIDDSLFENNETITADVQSVTNASTSGTTSLTATILDDDLPPDLTLTLDDTSIAETGGTTNLVASIPSVSGVPVSVTILLSGSATDNVDYSTSSLLLTIPVGQTSTSISLTAINDTLHETDETVAIGVDSVSGASTASMTLPTLTIADDDPAPTVTLQLISTTLAESSGSATLIATLDQVSGLDVTVPLSFDGTATLGTDYTLSSTQIVIPAGSTSGSLTIDASDDSLFEVDETIVVTAQGVTNASTSGTTSFTATLVDDDPQPQLSLSLGTANIAELGGSTSLVASIPSVSGAPVSLTISLNGSASNNVDYSASSLVLTIPVGQTSASLTLTSIDDALHEVDETISIGLVGVTGADATNTITPQLTILDDDPSPQLSVTLQDPSISEAAGSTNLVASIPSVSGTPVTVTFTLAGTATDNNDYSANTLSITIPVGQTTASLTLTANGDSIFEGDETVTFGIASVSGASTTGTTLPTLTILDDDSPPTVTLTASPTSMNESNGSSILTATLSATSSLPVTVNLDFSGSATSAVDYSHSSSQIVILPGNLSGSLTVSSLDDALVEGTETIVVDVASVSNGTESLTQQATVSILDDETPNLSISAVDNAVSENAGTTSIVATLSASSSQDIVVSLSFTGSATINVDYTSSNTQITIPAGSLSGSVQLTGTADNIAEPIENILVSVTSAPFANLVSNSSSATVAISEMSPILSVGLTSSQTLISENGGSLTLTAFSTDGRTSSQDMTVAFDFASGTTPAVRGTDYNVPAVVVIPAGQTSASVTLSSINNNISDGSRIARVGILTVAGLGAESGIQQVATTISDDESSPLVSLTVNPSNGQMNESGGQLSVIATLSHSSTQNITVTLDLPSVGSAPATLGTDYTRSATTITIPAGSLSGTISLSAINDTLNEPIETITVDIASVTNATENGTQRVTASILDDDPLPTVDLMFSSTSSIGEASGSKVVTAFLNTPSGRDVTVTLNYGGTASQGVDYSATSAITILAGQTSASMTLQTINDSLVEGDETVSISILSSGSLATIATTSGSPTVRSFTITDDESTAPSNIQISGSGVSGNFTSIGTLTVSASGPAGQVIQILANGVVVGTMTDSGSPGNYNGTIPSGNLRVGDNVIATMVQGNGATSSATTITYAPSYDEAYTVPGDIGTSNSFTISLPAAMAGYRSEVGYYVADDATGRINGLSPGDAGYAQAALSSATRHTLFAPGATAGSSVTVTLTGGQTLGFYLIQNSSAANFLQFNPANQLPAFAGPPRPVAFFSFDAANPDGIRHVQAIADRASGVSQYGWEDLTGGGDRDYNDMVVLVRRSGSASGVGAIRPPAATGQTVATTFTLRPGSQSATNTLLGEFGFYSVDDNSGTINGLRPGDAGYAAAALNNRTTVFNSGAATGTATQLSLPGNKLVGFYTITSGSAASLLSSNSANDPNAVAVALFSFDSANAGSLNHFRWFGPESAFQGTTGQGTASDRQRLHVMNQVFGSDSDFDNFQVDIQYATS